MRLDTRHLCLALLALSWQAHASAQALSETGQSAQGNETGQLAAPSVPAEQSGYVDLMAGLAYTDNALLTSNHPKSDGIATVGVNVDYRRRGTLSLNLLGNLDRIQYVRSSFGGSFYGRFFGSGMLGKSTGLLQWQLSDGFGEDMTDPLAAPTPQSLQLINDVSTGPLVNLHFGLTNRLTFFGVYSRTTYQRSPFDSQTYQGGTEFAHALSGAASLSLTASTAHTTYIESAAVRSFFAGSATSYDIRQAALAYKGKFVRTDFLLRAGYNTIQFGGGAMHGAPLYEVRLSRRISPFSTVFIDGRQLYTTNGGSLSSPGARIGLQVGASLNPGYAVAQPYNQRSADAGWLFNRARTSLSLTGNYTQQVFDQTTVTADRYNSRYYGVTATLGRQLRPTLRVQLQAQGYWNRYSRLGAQDRRETIGLTVSKRFARAMVWFYISRWHQTGTPGRSGFFASSYNDDRIGIYMTYDLFGERSMQPSMQGMPGFGASMGGY